MCFRISFCVRLLSTLLILGFGVTLMSAVSAAQTVPGPLVPGRQGNEFAKPPAAPRASATPGVRLTVEQMPPEQARNIKFKLRHIALQGNHAISSEELEKLWQPAIGQTISVEQLYDITNGITRYYADKGYALSFAILPAQKIDSGDVIIRVVEGFVDNAVITGQMRPKQNKIIKVLADKITQERPVRTATIERYLLLINDLPGIVAHATFASSKITEEASTMTVDIEYMPFVAQANANNRLPKTLGRWDLSAGAGLDGVLWTTDALKIEQHCGIYCNLYNSTAVSWSKVIGSEGLVIGVGVNRSTDSPNSNLLKALDFIGTGTSVSLSATYPLIRSRQENLNIGTIFSGSNLETDTFAGVLTHDKIRTVDLQGIYDIADSTGAVSLFGVDVIKGLPVFNATKDTDPTRSHINGTADFTIAKLRVLRNQPLGNILPALEGFTIYMQGAAQVSLDNPLLSASECTYGGGDIGRGYDGGALSGDHCLMGLIELRKDIPVGRFVLQPYTYADAGIVWQRGALGAGEARANGAQSVGGGMRIGFAPAVTAQIEMDIPLRHFGSEDGKGDPRFFLSLTAKY